jgi:membrane protease YdiL (CAAX protease family)
VPAWKARDAWKCIAMMVIFSFLFQFFERALASHFPAFRRWHGEGLGYLLVGILYNLTFLLTAFYFARTDSIASFIDATGLRKKPSDYVWFGIVFTVLLRAGSYFIREKTGITGNSYALYKHAIGTERVFYAAPILLAAFWEEPFMRGFLYKAFRGSYPIWTSIALMVVFNAITHSMYLRSIFATFTLSCMTVMVCYLREKSGSLWDCILCHLIFNGISLLVQH